MPRQTTGHTAANQTKKKSKDKINHPKKKENAGREPASPPPPSAFGTAGRWCRSTTITTKNAKKGNKKKELHSHKNETKKMEKKDTKKQLRNLQRQKKPTSTTPQNYDGPRAHNDKTLATKAKERDSLSFLE